MSRRVLALASLAAAGGCVVDRHADPAPVTEPRTCSAEVSLTSGDSATVPLPLDASGATVCVRLDATGALAPVHFAAMTDAVPGQSSGITVVLQDAADRLSLQDGWDVTPDDAPLAPPHTYANVEWNAPAGELTDAIVWLRAPVVPTTTTLLLSLVETE
ncbi:MAG TPA: hypothetical protein VG871_22630 [Vicinamibacterales bacterium]|nr:hypothetical protein [Vicinamibacterales bacterium]